MTREEKIDNPQEQENSRTRTRREGTRDPEGREAQGGGININGVCGGGGGGLRGEKQIKHKKDQEMKNVVDKRENEKRR